MSLFMLIMFMAVQPAEISLLPLGGAGLVFIALLRLLWVERRQWLIDRRDLIEAHRVERNEMRELFNTELAKKDEDRDLEVAFLRERVKRLEAELRAERGTG